MTASGDSTAIRHMRALFVELGFKRAGIWVIQIRDSTMRRFRERHDLSLDELAPVFRTALYEFLSLAEKDWFEEPDYLRELSLNTEGPGECFVLMSDLSYLLAALAVHADRDGTDRTTALHQALERYLDVHAGEPANQ
jgi:hypothetical protein